MRSAVCGVEQFISPALKIGSASLSGTGRAGTHGGFGLAETWKEHRRNKVESNPQQTLGVGQLGFTGSLSASRMGLSNSNSSATYPAIVPSENVTITPSSPSFSTFSMMMASLMGKRIPLCQTSGCPILLSCWSSSAMTRGGCNPCAAPPDCTNSGRTEIFVNY